MTAMPYPGRLLTIRDYAALPEDDRQRWELLEGNLIMSPSPTPDHMIAIGELYAQLRTQVPSGFQLIVDVDVDMQLAGEDEPGTSRRPDLIVVERDEVERVRAQGGLLRARSVAVVLEVISPGSRRTDLVIKRSEYADAGIPTYWIVDFDPVTSMIACHLVGGFGYVDEPAVTGRVQLTNPFPVHIDLDALS